MWVTVCVLIVLELCTYFLVHRVDLFILVAILYAWAYILASSEKASDDSCEMKQLAWEGHSSMRIGQN